MEKKNNNRPNDKDIIERNFWEIVVTLALLPLMCHWGAFGFLVIGAPLIIWWTAK